MTRYGLTLAAILAIGIPISAQEWHVVPTPKERHHATAQQIPSWDVQGHALEIPNLTVRNDVLTHSFRMSPPNCAIVAKHGKQLRYVDGFGGGTTLLKSHLNDRKLKKFETKGGSVQILPQGYTDRQFESAQNACFAGTSPSRQ